MNILSETTGKVLAERRLTTLGDLAQRSRAFRVFAFQAGEMADILVRVL